MLGLLRRLFQRPPPVTLVLHREASGKITVTTIGPCTPADALSVLERVRAELLRQKGESP